MQRAKRDISQDTVDEARRKALRIALGFFAASVTYIACSSVFLSLTFSDASQIAGWEVGKETLYVGLSTAILYYFIKRGLMGVADAREDLHQIINAMPDVFFSLDTQRRFTFVNKKGAELYGRGQSEILGVPIATLIPPQWVVALGAFLEKAQAEQRVWRQQVCSPSSSILYEFTAFPKTDGVSVFVRNVTEEREAEDRMRRLSMAIDNMADSFYVIDKNERFLFVNKSAAEFYRSRAEDMIGKSIWSYFAAHNILPVRKMLDECRKTNAVQRSQMNRDKTWVQVAVYPHGEEFLVFFQDVTQARDAGEKLKQERRQQSALAKFSVSAFQSDDTSQVEVAAELTASTLDADVVLIAEVDASRDRVAMIADAGLPDGAKRIFQLSSLPVNALVPALLHMMRPLRLSDLGPDATTPTLPQSVIAKSGIGVAAQAADGKVILLYAFSETLRDFTDGECEFMQTMVNMIVALRDGYASAETLRLRDRALEAITQGISITRVDPEGIPTIYTNPAFIRMTGYAASEIGNNGWETLFVKQLPPEINAAVAQSYHNGQPYALEVEFRRKDGATFIDSITTAPILNAHGEVTHYVAVHEDVTQQRRDEARLRRKNAMQAALASFTVEAFGAHNFTDIIRRAAGLARTILEADFATILDIDLSADSIHILAADGWDLGSRRVYKFSDWPQDGLIPYCCRSGQTVRFSDIHEEKRFGSDATLQEFGVRSGVVVTVKGWENIRGFFSIMSREVREFSDKDLDFLQTLANVVGMLKERERDLARLYMRDRALDAISQGITVTDESRANPTIIYTNPAFAEMTGYSIKELIGMSTRRFLPPEPPKGLLDRFADARANKREIRFDSAARRKDGTLFLDHVTAAPIVNADGELTHYVAVHEDITLARQHDERLHESQRMEAVGQLTGGIAHDFNNLLTVVRANAEDMRDELATSPLLYRQAEMILQAATRGADLVQQLMAFARKQELEPKVVDVNAMLESFIRLVRRTMQENVDMEVLPGRNVPAIKVDPSRLENALLNLILNARDAMPDGGKITIETHVAFLDQSYTVENPGVHVGRYVLLAVSDTGTGMPRDVVEKAFQPFFTTKDVGKGTGLGLSMVYGFVRQSGGHAKIYSEVGHGTTVKIYLPPTEAPLTEETPSGKATSRAAGSGHILLVEDDDLVRESVEAKLLRLGYSVTPVASAAEALSALEQNPHFDLVFTDVIMPGAMTGADLARDVTRRWPHIKVLMTSGYTEASALGKVDMPHGVRLLSKPYSSADLAQTFREVLGLTV